MPSHQQSQDSPRPLLQQKAVEILSALLKDATSLTHEPFASPKRSEWTNTARAALERSGVTASLLQTFDTSQSMVFSTDTTDEEMRQMENENLAGMEAVLRSAVVQLGWELGKDPQTASTPLSEVQTEQSSQAANTRFFVNKAQQFVVDGEILPGVKVWETESGFRNLSASSEDLDSLSKLSFRSLGGYFDSIQVSFSDEDQNPVDWDFGSIEINLTANQSEKIEVAFRIVYDLEFWAKPYSIAEIATAIESVLEKSRLPFSYWQEDENTCIEGFGVSIEMSSAESLGDALQHQPELLPLAHLVRDELGEEQAAVNMAFEFPPTIKSACEQYLVYFVQFLRDLGIEANAEIKEHASKVLFSVTPADKDQALGRIREALQLYLRLPHVPEFITVATQFNDVAVSQLQANVYHLRSQIMLAKAALEMKNATMAAKDERIALLQERIDLREFQPKKEEKKNEDKEDIVKDMVAVKKYDLKFMEINLPELLRKLKRRFQ